MIKQIDRVVGDLRRQAGQFHEKIDIGSDIWDRRSQFR